MPLQYRAAVLHSAQTPMSIETVAAAELKPTDVLVRIRAALSGHAARPHVVLLAHAVDVDVGGSRVQRAAPDSRKPLPAARG